MSKPEGTCWGFSWRRTYVLVFSRYLTLVFIQLRVGELWYQKLLKAFSKIAHSECAVDAANLRTVLVRTGETSRPCACGLLIRSGVADDRLCVQFTTSRSVFQTQRLSSDPSTHFRKRMSEFFVDNLCRRWSYHTMLTAIFWARERESRLDA